MGIVEVSNLVVREHMKFIKDTLMEKHDIFFIRVGYFPDWLKTATLKSMYEKGDENIHNYQAVLS